MVKPIYLGINYALFYFVPSDFALLKNLTFAREFWDTLLRVWPRYLGLSIERRTMHLKQLLNFLDWHIEGGISNFSGVGMRGT